MTTKYEFLTREEVFELMKLYAEKAIDSLVAGNKDVSSYCDKMRLQFLEELKNRDTKIDVSKRIGA